MADPKQWLERFDALTQRERVIILVAVLISLVAVLFTYLVEPAYKDHQKMRTSLVKMKASNAQLNLELVTLGAVQPVDPNRALAAEVEQLKQQLVDAEIRLNELSRGLVTAREMVDLLERVLDSQKKLTLLSAQSLPAETLDIPDNSGVTRNAADKSTEEESRTAASVSGKSPESQVYRHPFELLVEGSYADTLEYLKTLESLNKGFFWEVIEYEVADYPKARIRIRTHTLGLEKSWLGV